MGSGEECAPIQAAVSFLDRFAALKLKNPYLLPVIEDASFVLLWPVIGQEKVETTRRDIFRGDTLSGFKRMGRVAMP